MRKNSNESSRGGARGNSRSANSKKKDRGYHTKARFPERAEPEWQGPLVDYKEIDLLRKFLTASNKLMSRKRAGTSAAEQRAIKRAVKHARFMGLLPFQAT
ncbi:MAG: 30S ribosomal protein S18 [Phycisphaerae bacterium]|nr:30S ribosomal protein S18 [Phycisphaerae bacterium]